MQIVLSYLSYYDEESFQEILSLDFPSCKEEASVGFEKMNSLLKVKPNILFVLGRSNYVLNILD